MRVFLYEYITGGGSWHESAPTPPQDSLLWEGSAMISALADDFSQIKDVEVFALRDARLPQLSLPHCQVTDVSSASQERDLIYQLSEASDYTVMIAPEIDEILLSRCRQVEAGVGKLLCPGSHFVEVAADKQYCAERLVEAGVPMPAGESWESGRPLPRCFQFPAVVKPRFGAGSKGVKRWDVEPKNVGQARPLNGVGSGEEMRWEVFCPGTPVSVALLMGPKQSVALPACRQRLTDDGSFQYLGGSLPLKAELNKRAIRLAEAAVRAMPAAIGYVGVDLILGDDSSGCDDKVIEINPRLTTSYVGLRAYADSNLAAAMLAVAESTDVELSFTGRRVAFDADGTVK